MRHLSPDLRRFTDRLIRIGTVFSAVMIIVSASAILNAKNTPASAAGTVAGAAQVVDGNTLQQLTSGGSTTAFTFVLPTGAACTGDSANGGYRVQSFMVLSSVDPTTLTFGSQGPNPAATGANFSEPLFPPGGGSPYVNAQTALAQTMGGPGQVVNIPRFNFSAFTTGQIPAGTYLLGIACTIGSGAQAVDKVWDVQFVFTTSTTDPLGVTWTASAATTTTTTTSTTVGGTTSTSGSTTSLTTGSATSDTSGSGTVAGDTQTSTPGPSSLATTGSNPLPLIVWALLFLWFGRMAVLVSRRTEVRSRDDS
jgi:hypothetical protein